MRYTHPTGSVYFYNAKLHLITPSDIEFDLDARDEVTRLREEYLAAVRDDATMARVGDVLEMDVVVRLGDCEEEHELFFLHHSKKRHIVVGEDGEYSPFYFNSFV